ncbi:hypothetical protein [Frigoriglobus tundricola]|uniref:Intracellular proteinase inhibitor BsuPI domain-containing protein n=1 Tax=Frigoriglobus tundricola TaxID=2774151 RepID=A0A6M5Z3Y8_9BACT|nr:hypothetical protein [Frigoriglobus tundricola]QJX00806.1 hypothetical protein FTUN_8444 [Frigoriglobus tundricola]
MKWFLLVLTVFAHAPTGSAEDRAPESPVTLKLVAKTDTYAFDGSGKTTAEYKAALEETARTLEKGERANPPKPLTVDLVLQFTNTSKEEVTIHVRGDANVYTFELKGGAGVVTMKNPVAFTEEFRLPRPVTLAPGKSYEIPVKTFADGRRGLSRLLFWTGPGEYTLSAKYTLADKDGGKAAELTSEPVKITVTDK